MARRTFAFVILAGELIGKIIAFLAIFVRGTSSGAVTVAILIASSVDLRMRVGPGHTIGKNAISVLKDLVVGTSGTFVGFRSAAFFAGEVTNNGRVNAFSIDEDLAVVARNTMLGVNISASLASDVTRLTFATEEDFAIGASGTILCGNTLASETALMARRTICLIVEGGVKDCQIHAFSAVMIGRASSGVVAIAIAHASAGTELVGAFVMDVVQLDAIKDLDTFAIDQSEMFRAGLAFFLGGSTAGQASVPARNDTNTVSELISFVAKSAIGG